VKGAAAGSSGTFTLSGSGADIWGASDTFQFAYKPLTGDGQLVARVAAVQQTHRWAKAAVMIRATLNANAPFAMMLVSPGAGTAFQYRSTGGGLAASVPGTAATAPHWVKIVRAGSVIRGYQSADGSSWRLVGSATIPMGSSVKIGLAVSSHDNATLCKASFDHVS